MKICFYSVLCIASFGVLFLEAGEQKKSRYIHTGEQIELVLHPRIKYEIPGQDLAFVPYLPAGCLNKFKKDDGLIYFLIVKNAGGTWNAVHRSPQGVYSITTEMDEAVDKKTLNIDKSVINNCLKQGFADHQMTSNRILFSQAQLNKMLDSGLITKNTHVFP